MYEKLQHFAKAVGAYLKRYDLKELTSFRDVVAAYGQLLSTNLMTLRSEEDFGIIVSKIANEIGANRDEFSNLIASINFTFLSIFTHEERAILSNNLESSLLHNKISIAIERDKGIKEERKFSNEFIHSILPFFILGVVDVSKGK